jgi:ATP-dependent helicase HrpB
VVTEGILTRMIQRDPELSGVGLVILDEFHERSLQADLALALLLDVQQGLRDDLKLLIMSATLDNDRLQRLLPRRRPSPLKGARSRWSGVFRRLPRISVLMKRSRSPLRSCCARSAARCCCSSRRGEIQRVQAQLAERVADDVVLCPLYGALPLSEQRKAILPAAGSAQSGAGDQYRRDQLNHRRHPAGGR